MCELNPTRTPVTAPDPAPASPVPDAVEPQQDPAAGTAPAQGAVPGPYPRTHLMVRFDDPDDVGQPIEYAILVPTACAHGCGTVSIAEAGRMWLDPDAGAWTALTGDKTDAPLGTYEYALDAAKAILDHHGSRPAQGSQS